MLLAYDKHAAFRWALPFLVKNLVIVYGHAQPKNLDIHPHMNVRSLVPQRCMLHARSMQNVPPGLFLT
jgi:hypothetical protein